MSWTNDTVRHKHGLNPLEGNNKNTNTQIANKLKRDIRAAAFCHGVCSLPLFEWMVTWHWILRCYTAVFFLIFSWWRLQLRWFLYALIARSVSQVHHNIKGGRMPRKWTKRLRQVILWLCWWRLLPDLCPLKNTHTYTRKIIIVFSPLCSCYSNAYPLHSHPLLL